MGMTISSATKVFTKQALQDDGLPFRLQVTKNINSHAITLKIDKDGTLALSDWRTWRR